MTVYKLWNTTSFSRHYRRQVSCKLNAHSPFVITCMSSTKDLGLQWTGESNIKPVWGSQFKFTDDVLGLKIERPTNDVNAHQPWPPRYDSLVLATILTVIGKMNVYWNALVIKAMRWPVADVSMEYSLTTKSKDTHMPIPPPLRNLQATFHTRF